MRSPKLSGRVQAAPFQNRNWTICRCSLVLSLQMPTWRTNDTNLCGSSFQALARDPDLRAAYFPKHVSRRADIVLHSVACSARRRSANIMALKSSLERVPCNFVLDLHACSQDRGCSGFQVFAKHLIFGGADDHIVAVSLSPVELRKVLLHHHATYVRSSKVHCEQLKKELSYQQFNGQYLGHITAGPKKTERNEHTLSVFQQLLLRTKTSQFFQRRHFAWMLPEDARNWPQQGSQGAIAWMSRASARVPSQFFQQCDLEWMLTEDARSVYQKHPGRTVAAVSDRPGPTLTDHHHAPDMSSILQDRDAPIFGKLDISVPSYSKPCCLVSPVFTA